MIAYRLRKSYGIHAVGMLVYPQQVLSGRYAVVGVKSTGEGPHFFVNPEDLESTHDACVLRYKHDNHPAGTRVYFHAPVGPNHASVTTKADGTGPYFHVLNSDLLLVPVEATKAPATFEVQADRLTLSEGLEAKGTIPVPADPAPEEDLIERSARRVYDVRNKEAWVPNGNSPEQDYARQTARAILKDVADSLKPEFQNVLLSGDRQAELWSAVCSKHPGHGVFLTGVLAARIASFAHAVAETTFNAYAQKTMPEVPPFSDAEAVRSPALDRIEQALTELKTNGQRVAGLLAEEARVRAAAVEQAAKNVRLRIENHMDGSVSIEHIRRDLEQQIASGRGRLSAAIAERFRATPKPSALVEALRGLQRWEAKQELGFGFQVQMVPSDTGQVIRYADLAAILEAHAK